MKKKIEGILFQLQRFAVIKGTSGHDYLETKVEKTVVYGYAGNDTLRNMFNDVTISGGDGTDSLVSGKRLYHWDNPREGVREETVTSGISMSGGIGDDYLDIDGSYSTLKGDDGNDIIWSYQHGFNILDGGAGHDSIENWSGQNSTLIGGAGKDTLYNNGHGSTMLGGNGNDIMENDAAYVYMNGGENDDDIWSHGGSGVTITGGAGNDVIWSQDNSSGSVVGGSGNDDIYVYNHTANISLAGGKGNDMISLTGDVTAEIQYNFSDGNDTIYGFDENDVLYIAGSKFSTTASDDNSMIVKVGNNTITINNAADKFLDIEKVESLPGGDDDDEDKLPTGLTYNKNKTAITASKNFTGKSIDLTEYPKVTTLNASALKKSVQIIGNSLGNSIKGGFGKDNISGGEGADTLIGGKGNDTLTGGKGKDIFVYAKGDGKDTITDYKVGQDKIKISSGKITKATVKGKNVIFTVGSGTITVKNGKGKKITITDADGKTTTKKYTKTQNISSNVSNLWFAEENNFATSGNLSEITKTDLTPTTFEKISATNYENLTAKNDFVTYSDK